jgi:hypothetical protein
MPHNRHPGPVPNAHPDPLYNHSSVAVGGFADLPFPHLWLMAVLLRSHGILTLHQEAVHQHHTAPVARRTRLQHVASRRQVLVDLPVAVDGEVLQRERHVHEPYLQDVCVRRELGGSALKCTGPNGGPRYH